MSRWPELVDVVEPTESDLLDEPTDGAKYVLLTLPVTMLDHRDAIFELARSHRLRGYSGVAGDAF